jgi:hypothetical protein
MNNMSKNTTRNQILVFINAVGFIIIFLVTAKHLLKKECFLQSVFNKDLFLLSLQLGIFCYVLHYFTNPIVWDYCLSLCTISLTQ